MATAEVLDFGVAASGDPIDEAFELILEALHGCPTEDALARSDRYQNKLLAFDAQVLATKVEGGATDRETEKLAGRSGGRSKREARKRVRRAKTISKNPDLGTDLADQTQELGPEKLDAIADASERTDGAAATDSRFIKRIKTGSADDANKIADEYVDDHKTPDEHEERRRRQRRSRKVKRFITNRGLDAILAEGDAESIAEIWTQLTATSKQLYEQDGGRDVSPDRQPRTRDQRLFDAFHEAIVTAPAASAARTDTDDPDRRPARAKATIHITLTVDDWLSDRSRARMLGGGTIPASLLDEYLRGDTWLRGTLFDGDGEVLWHGRRKRYATAAQASALTVRDEGCTLCHAHPQGCESHHLIPWHAPAQGQTNTPEMAQVCSDCHHHLHHNKLTLYRDRRSRTWQTRPASSSETPP